MDPRRPASTGSSATSTTWRPTTASSCTPGSCSRACCTRRPGITVPLSYLLWKPVAVVAALLRRPRLCAPAAPGRRRAPCGARPRRVLRAAGERARRLDGLGRQAAPVHVRLHRRRAGLGAVPVGLPDDGDRRRADAARAARRRGLAPAARARAKRYASARQPRSPRWLALLAAAVAGRDARARRGGGRGAGAGGDRASGPPAGCSSCSPRVRAGRLLLRRSSARTRPGSSPARSTRRATRRRGAGRGGRSRSRSPRSPCPRRSPTATPAATWQDVAARVWPLAALAVYLAPVGTFPYHSFQGLAIPLAILAVQGVRSVLAAPAPPGAVVAALLVMTVPGIAHKLRGGGRTRSAPPATRTSSSPASRRRCDSLERRPAARRRARAGLRRPHAPLPHRAGGLRRRAVVDAGLGAARGARRGRCSRATMPPAEAQALGAALRRAVPVRGLPARAARPRAGAAGRDRARAPRSAARPSTSCAPPEALPLAPVRRRPRSSSRLRRVSDRSGIQPNDEGLMLQAAARIADGQVPYRDFWWFYPPGQPYLLGGLWEALGPSLLTWQVVRVLARRGRRRAGLAARPARGGAAWAALARVARGDAGDGLPERPAPVPGHPGAAAWARCCAWSARRSPAR